MPKVEKNEENMSGCSCPNCPSYNDCAKTKDESLYCASLVGKSICSYEMQGCICGPCPVYQANGLTQKYYCLSGPEE